MAVYIVLPKDDDEHGTPRMIEARTKAAAIAYAARTSLTAERLSTKQAVQWAQKGYEIEEA